MVLEMHTLPIDEKDQIVLPAPKAYALAVRRVSDDTVRVYVVSDKDLLALLGDQRQVELPGDVLQFSREHNLIEHVEQAIHAVCEVFAGAERVAVSLRHDEYGDPYVAIDVAVHEGPESEANKYSACMERWAAVLPPQVGEKIQLTTSWASS